MARLHLSIFIFTLGAFQLKAQDLKSIFLDWRTSDIEANTLLGPSKIQAVGYKIFHLDVSSLTSKLEGVTYREGLINGFIAELKFPVFCAGTSPLDSSGRQIAIEMQTQVRCGRMQVNPKDWVVADELGVVFIPQHLVDEVTKLASEKQLGESIVRNELAAGQDIGEVFARHGIL